MAFNEILLMLKIKNKNSIINYRNEPLQLCMGIGQLLGILPILCTLLESHVLCLFSSQNTNTHIEEYKIYENQNIITILINMFLEHLKKTPNIP